MRAGAEITEITKMKSSRTAMNHEYKKPNRNTKVNKSFKQHYISSLASLLISENAEIFSRQMNIEAYRQTYHK